MNKELNKSIVMSRGELHISKWCRRMKNDRLKEKEGRERNLTSRVVTVIYIKERRGSCLNRKANRVNSGQGPEIV